MRFLKKKVCLKFDDSELDFNFHINKEESSQSTSEGISPIQQHFTKDLDLGARGPTRHRTSPDADSKNIIKNYGKALCAFASSDVAVPYIECYLQRYGHHNVDVKKFMHYMKLKKETTSSMENVRQLLIEEEDDSEEMKIYKQIFKEVSIIFMKYFSVNWIFNGKLVHKNVHLKFRFKMLRRIQDPEHFTYLKSATRTF